MHLYESLFVVATSLGERDLRLTELLQVRSGGVSACIALHMARGCVPVSPGHHACLRRTASIP